MIDTLLKDVIRKFGINRVVETGTDKGETVAQVSQWFAEIAPDFGTILDTRTDGSRSYNAWSDDISYPVFSDVKQSTYQIHSVDLDFTSYNKAQENFKSNSNIHLHHESSEQFIKSLLEVDSQSTNNGIQTLFFLDAHWGKYWPLRDELKHLIKLNRYLVVIDDFMVPGKSNPAYPHGEFGFDIYKGRILNWAYICDLFTETKVRTFYPNQPNRDRRGWVLITHGYSDEELSALKEFDLFEIDQNDEQHTLPVKATLRTYLDGRNLLKTIIPVTVLRDMYRLYEKCRFSLSKKK